MARNIIDAGIKDPKNKKKQTDRERALSNITKGVISLAEKQRKRSEAPDLATSDASSTQSESAVTPRQRAFGRRNRQTSNIA